MGQMEATLVMVRESMIRKTMQAAIDDKAALCAIERELVAKMDQCLVQLREELRASEDRGAGMADVLAKLPSPEDPAAVRGYRSRIARKLEAPVLQA